MNEKTVVLPVRILKPTLLERIRCWLFPETRCPVDGIPHDYRKRNGGDGIPTHFYDYTCSKCGQKFSI